MKVLVVGCGSIGSRHIGNLLEIGHEVWGYDVDKSKFQHEWFVDHKDFHMVGCYGSPFPDVVFICTPVSDHYREMLRWENYHLFVEKPLCKNREELEAIKGMKFSRTNMVACNMRFEPLIEQVYGFLQELGQLYSVKVDFGYNLADWRPNVNYKKVEHPGVVLDSFHELDLLRYFHGEPDIIQSQSKYTHDYEDDLLSFVDAIVTFDDNLAVANIHLDYHRDEKRRRIEWIGSKGTMTYVEERSLKDPDGDNYLYFDGEKYYNKEDHNYPYKKQLEHFFDCVDKGIQTCNPIKEAVRTMEFAFKLEG